jgi:predicted nucleic acid-binding protein
MDGEGVPGDSTMEQAVYWKQVYTEILAMEEKVVARVRQLMETQSETARHEVELTNVPVVVAQAERFRQRLGYWDARILELRANGRPHT